VAAGSRLATIIRSFVDSDSGKRVLVIYGDNGIGKTYTVRQVLDRCKVDYEYITGHITPLRFYRALYNNRDGILVIDDVLALLKDKVSQALILAAMGNDKVCWMSSASKLEDLPEEFEYSGKMIMIFNEPKTNNSVVDEAIADRAIMYMYRVSKEELKRKFVEICEAEGIPDDLVEEWLAKRKDLTLRDIGYLKLINNCGDKSLIDEFMEMPHFKESEEINSEIKKLLAIGKPRAYVVKYISEKYGISRRAVYYRISRVCRN